MIVLAYTYLADFSINIGFQAKTLKYVHVTVKKLI
jgi:hypothetical protein